MSIKLKLAKILNLYSTQVRFVLQFLSDQLHEPETKLWGIPAGCPAVLSGRRVCWHSPSLLHVMDHCPHLVEIAGRQVAPFIIPGQICPDETFPNRAFTNVCSILQVVLLRSCF